MKEAFTYMFKDPMYEKKAMSYFLICFASLALMATPELNNISDFYSMTITPTIKPINPLLNLLPLAGTLFNFILCGYFYTCVQAITNQNNNIVLPYLKIGSSFAKGFCFAIFFFSLTLSPIALLFGLLGSASTTVFVCLSMIVALMFLIYTPAFLWLFANEGKLSTFFAWRKVINLVNLNKKTYFKNYSILFLLTLLGAIISLVFMFLFNFLLGNVYLAWIATSIVGAIIASYIAFVGMYLLAKSFKSDSVV